MMMMMSVLPILKYPHPVLRQCCTPVVAFDEALQALVANMVETLYACEGAIGLAAPQVGHPVRVVVIDMQAKTTKDALRVLVNPVVLSASRNKTMREGCLSFPEYLANVKRAQRVVVEAYTATGERQEWEASHLEAVCIQHEIDHLDGVLMIDRIESLKDDWITRRTL
jgi:peptide deformylase